MKFYRSCLLFTLACFSASDAGAAVVTLTGTIRDFLDTHPDFENGLGTDPGIVESTLGVDGKPVYAGLAGNPTTHGETEFDQWYRDVAGVNLSASHSITLDNTITADPVDRPGRQRNDAGLPAGGSPGE